MSRVGAYCIRPLRLGHTRAWAAGTTGGRSIERPYGGQGLRILVEVGAISAGW